MLVVCSECLFPFWGVVQLHLFVKFIFSSDKRLSVLSFPLLYLGMYSSVWFVCFTPSGVNTSVSKKKGGGGGGAFGWCCFFKCKCKGNNANAPCNRIHEGNMFSYIQCFLVTEIIMSWERRSCFLPSLLQSNGGNSPPLQLSLRICTKWSRGVLLKVSSSRDHVCTHMHMDPVTYSEAYE